MARGRPGPVEMEALAYAVGHDGECAGLADQTVRRLVGADLAERYPRRASYQGRSGSAGYKALYHPFRLTERGFRTADAPYRTGQVRFLFRLEDEFPGRSVALMCKDDRLRIVVSPLEPARVPYKSLPMGFLPPAPPASQAKDYDGLPGALDALERLGEWAGRHTGAAGMLIDPAFLAWDAPVLALERMGEDGRTFEPHAFEDVLRTMRDAVPGDGFRP